MKIIKTLPKEFCFEMIEGQTDLIRKEKQEIDKHFQKVICKCGGNVSQIPLFINNMPVFDHILPKYVAKCNQCKSEFDPYTGVVYKC